MIFITNIVLYITISNNPRDPEESTEDHYDLVTVKYVYDLVADLSKNG